tara:strand:+ start:3276 stop:4688 length:1413 start_codon:yes stop_codon:yes gene_type:complete
MKNNNETKMKYEEKELAILRLAVDLAEKKASSRIVNSPDVKKIISIVERFIKDKKLICYGGTAINNILPKEDQFYDLNIEIPDYDFYSDKALEHTKELADIYVKEGFEEVEAKAGMHYGTYKVFVNFIPVADITLMDTKLFSGLKEDAIKVAGMYYCPANYLRMSMYLELSRPGGDVSRWEKVLKRLTLLNKHRPLRIKNCNYTDFVREYDDNFSTEIKTIYNTTRQTFIDQGLVFFGGYASFVYSQFMPSKVRKKFLRQPDFDVLSDDPNKSAIILKERLNDEGIRNVQIIEREKLGDIISTHYEVRVKQDTIAFIYKPLGCHSYNNIYIHNEKIRIATIDTMLSFYLVFIYAGRKYYDKDRIMCMANFLFAVQQKNRLEQKGALRRFSVTCYGTQKTKESIKEEKTEKFKELKEKSKTREYDEWFLKYRPGDISRDKKNKREQTKKNKAKGKPKKKQTRRNKKLLGIF